MLVNGERKIMMLDNGKLYITVEKSYNIDHISSMHCKTNYSKKNIKFSPSVVLHFDRALFWQILNVFVHGDFGLSFISLPLRGSQYQL